MNTYDPEDFDKIRQENIHFHLGPFKNTIINILNIFPSINTIAGVFCISFIVFLLIQIASILNNILSPSLEDKIKEEEDKFNKKIEDNRAVKDAQSKKMLKFVK